LTTDPLISGATRLICLMHAERELAMHSTYGKWAGFTFATLMLSQCEVTGLARGSIRFVGISLSNVRFELDFTPLNWGFCYKRASRELGFEFNFNTHSMRKTWGYHAYENGADILYIQALLNHSNQHVTLKYIGVTKTTIQQLYRDHTLEIAS